MRDPLCKYLEETYTGGFCKTSNRRMIDGLQSVVTLCLLITKQEDWRE